jgi:hypothetical protein
LDKEGVVMEHTRRGFIAALVGGVLAPIGAILTKKEDKQQHAIIKSEILELKVEEREPEFHELQWDAIDQEWKYGGDVCYEDVFPNNMLPELSGCFEPVTWEPFPANCQCAEPDKIPGAGCSACWTCGICGKFGGFDNLRGYDGLSNARL